MSKKTEVEPKITILRGLKGLVGMYLGEELVATHDKFAKDWEIDQCAQQHGGEGCTIVEKVAKFYKFADIPERIKDTDFEDIPSKLRTLKDVLKSKSECVGEACLGCSVCAEAKGA